jgi:hypothetical protein
MDSFLSHALTFVGGVLAKWFQGLLQDRRKERDSLREGTLRPIRAQIHNAIPQFEQNARVTSVDLGQWDRLVAAGTDRDIPETLRAAIKQLYTTDLPTHERVWQTANEEVTQVMLLADANLGGNRAGNLPLQPWWKFLLAETFEPSLIAWSSGGPARLWNKQLDPMKLMTPPATRKDLLKRIWVEGQGRPPIHNYRQFNAQCVANAKDCLRFLDAELEGNFVTRLSKRLHWRLP